MNISINTGSFILSITLIMLSWLFISISFFVWGRFLAKLLGFQTTGNKGIIANIWLGLAFCIFFFSIYHIFLSIDAFASCIFYFPAVIFFFIKYRKKLLNYIKSIGKLKLTVIFLTLSAAAAISLQSPTNFDTGLYHLNTKRKFD